MFTSSDEKRRRRNSSGNASRYDQRQEDGEKARSRLQRPLPTFQRVVLMDMQRRKLNQIFERRRHLDINGPRGLERQCKKELERLETHERDLRRASLDLARMTLQPSISRYPLLYNGHARRLSSIAEEHVSLPPIEESKSTRGRSLSMVNSTLHQLKHVSTSKVHADVKHSQQMVARTNDDRSYLQQQTRLLNQQKRLLEQKVKDFLH